MSIFSKDKVVTVAQRFDAAIDYIRSIGDGYEEAGRLEDVLSTFKSRPDASAIKPAELCADIVECIIHNKAYSPGKYLTLYNTAEMLYQAVFIYDDETPDFDKLRLVFLEMYRERGVVEAGMFDLKLFNSFNDKSKYIVLFQAICTNPNARDVFGKIVSYGLEIREFMMDDDAYLNNLIKVATRLSRQTADQMDATIAEEMLDVKRMNGIYNVDPVQIAQVERNVSAASQIIASGVDVLSQVDEKGKYLVKLTEDVEARMETKRKGEESALENKVNVASEQINKIINDFVETQKKVVVMEKDILIKQVFADAEAELTKYKSMAKTIAASTSMEIANLNRNAEGVLSRVTNFMNNDSQIQKALENEEMNRALMEKINKLNMISDTNIETMQKHMEQTAARMAVSQASASAIPAPVEPAMTTDMTVDIPPVNPLLDPAIPFASRWDIVMKEKKRREDAGEHFHRAFDDVLMGIMEDANPYLIGPSGCGKTFMIKQIASLLNMEFIDIGYINEEYDILGFQTATGAYSTPNFYRCYKFGIIAFCDELDNGNSRATVKLNSFLTNNLDSSYNFPNGECVQRHPNFRIVAAGNTEGNGADANYNTREKIEESVQQRFLPVHVGYDNTVEQNILRDYPDWFQFVVLFRDATDKWSEVNGIAAQGILTTRDTSRIKRYLDNGSFSPEKIIKYEFVQTKDAEYLAFLLDEMKKNHGTGNFQKAGDILKIFSSQVADVRKNGRG